MNDERSAKNSLDCYNRPPADSPPAPPVYSPETSGGQAFMVKQLQVGAGGALFELYDWGRAQ